LPANWKATDAPGDAVVTKWVVLDELVHPSLQPEELLWAEEVCKKDPKVKAACEAVGIDQSTIAIDGQ
jgi:primary-amine oxidase